MNPIFRIGRRIANMIYYTLSVRKRHSLKIMDIKETASDIIRNKKSISRYGDGEFDLIFNYLGYSSNECGFQAYSRELSIRLIEILKAKPLNNHLIGLPGSIGSGGVRKFRWEDARYWQNYLRKHLLHLHEIIQSDRLYGDANFTRFYLPFRNKSKVRNYVNELKEIWHNREVLIIEGVMTRLGVNNDLFEGVKSVKRIIAPAKDAFSKYDEIYNAALSYLNSHDADTLVLVSLGATATILTYDLSNAGYQAIDTGHIDLEYEWMLKGAKKKVKVDGKFVNEVKGEDVDTVNSKSDYESQIIAIVN